MKNNEEIMILSLAKFLDNIPLGYECGGCIFDEPGPQDRLSVFCGTAQTIGTDTGAPKRLHSSLIAFDGTTNGIHGFAEAELGDTIVYATVNNRFCTVDIYKISEIFYLSAICELSESFYFKTGEDWHPHLQDKLLESQVEATLFIANTLDCTEPTFFA